MESQPPDRNKRRTTESNSDMHSAPDTRPPKRIRKAINCEPCRASKLKCDRARPCSGCVLRGTVLQCYPDEPKSEGPSSEQRTPDDAQSSARIDLRGEIARIRQSLTILEGAIPRSQPASFATAGAPGRDNSAASSSHPGLSLISVNSHSNAGPSAGASTNGGLLPSSPSKSREGGLYVGPTSAVTALLNFRNDDSDVHAGSHTLQPSESGEPAYLMNSRDPQQNLDLLSQLPEDVVLVDGLIRFFFENCTYFYSHLNQPAFFGAWGRFKQSPFTDHLVLSTLFVVLAITLQYLPAGHSILASLPGKPEELGERYYASAVTSLARYKLFRHPPNLELIELLLLRTHYLSISKNDCEETWAIRSELISAGTAMGLHRDPGKWRMPRDVIDRRRWAWWNLIVMERWHAFLFGRPLAISPHHFDTKFPMDDNYEPDATVIANPNLSYLASFRLAVILGDIVDDAVSIVPVSYERIQQHDRALEKWHELLPSDLLADPQQVAMNFSLSTPLDLRRTSVQSMCLRAQMYHIRFALHRPYASPPPQGTGTNQSFDMAVHSATQVIQFLTVISPDFMANVFLAVPGHIAWGGYHLFAAAIFFSFQLITHPDHTKATIFRADIQQAIKTLETMAPSVILADKSIRVLRALMPLYDEDLDEVAKTEQLNVVRSLSFPCHDSPMYPRNPMSSATIQGPSPTSGPPMYLPNKASGLVTSPPQGSISPQGQHPSATSSPGPMYQQNPGQQSQIRHSYPGPSNYAHGPQPQQQQQAPSNIHTESNAPPPQYPSVQRHPSAGHPQHSQQLQQNAAQYPANPTDDALWSVAIGDGSEWGRSMSDVMRNAGNAPPPPR